MTTDKKTDARKLDHATLEVMRLRAIEATKAGMKATDLALAYGVHRRTVFRWLTIIKPLFAVCAEQGILASDLMRFEAVVDTACARTAY